MNPQSISSLPIRTEPVSTDVMLVQVAGLLQQMELLNLPKALPVATLSEKGLMSAADKAAIQQILSDLAAMTSYQIITVASAATVSLPNPSGFITVVTFTGTTEITTINNLQNNRLYLFRYPTGVGLTILGKVYAAGDINMIFNT